SDRSGVRPSPALLSAASGVLLPDPRPDDQESAGQRCRRIIPLRDLLPVGRAAPSRRGDDRRRERLRPLAGPGRYRGAAGRSFLGGRAGASGLPAALSRGLHVPLTPGGLEAAAACECTVGREP